MGDQKELHEQELRRGTVVLACLLLLRRSEYGYQLLEALQAAGIDVDANTLVSEEYLMTLERQAFCALVQHPKTQERILGMLNTGKPVRN